VGPSLLGADAFGLVDHVQAGVLTQLHTGVAQRPARGLAAGAGERRHVRTEVHVLRVQLPHERGQLALGGPVADHQSAAALAQRCVDVAQALEHELRPGARGVAAVEQAVVQAEHTHDALRGVERGAQRGVVVHAQVAPEPDDGRHHPESTRRRAARLSARRCP